MYKRQILGIVIGKFILFFCQGKHSIGKVRFTVIDNGINPPGFADGVFFSGIGICFLAFPNFFCIGVRIQVFFVGTQDRRCLLYTSFP